MNQPAKAQEPSMEEILASIRRIIADEDSGKAAKPAAAPAPPPPKPMPVPPPVVAKPPPPPSPPKPPAAANNQADIDAMLASMDAAPKPPEAVAPPPAPPPAPPKPVAPPAVDVLDLTEAMAAPAPPAQSFRTIDAASDVFFAEGGSEPQPEPPRPSTPPVFDRGLMSNSTRSAVDHAFNSLANTVLGNNARTLEDLVKEMLRPMLKSWLDDNLPNLVERIVRAEIERVSRGGRG
ncbi:MAG: DUF2497 domain-containing protein [Pseudolabrys sp.]|jgi:hypothetical protein